MPTKAKKIVVEVRRDYDGKVFSQVRDENRDRYRDDSKFYGDSVVIDRQKGRYMDSETIRYRAESLAYLLGVKYEEDLTWPCGAKRGFIDCHCPDCVERIAKEIDDAAKVE